MATRAPFGVGEWYHCYNRGFEKSVVFKSKKDYERFMLLMYLSNGKIPVHVREALGWNLHDTLSDPSLERGDSLVEIGAYSLMPNHIHLILLEIRKGGTGLFMQKLFTGYTMYFNKKYDRTGALFSGTFKSKYIADDRYLKRVIPYVLLNPLELFEPKWKLGLGNIRQAEKQLRAYPYSSLQDFFEERPEKKIVGSTITALYDKKPAMAELLSEAQAYYREKNAFT